MERPYDESWFHAPLTAVGEEAALAEEEVHHLRHVLRVRPERPITITNGHGGVFRCTTEVRASAVVATARELVRHEAEPPRIHCVLALLKGRDSEEPVEGICQLEVAAIHLVITDHTQAPKGQDHTRLLERLHQKSLAALKQAKKPWLTEIHAPVPLRAWRAGHPGNLIVVHPGDDDLPPTGKDPFYLLTGPEGGFSDGELEWLSKDGNTGRLGLGRTRIRGTHAPLLACGKLMGKGSMA